MPHLVPSLVLAGLAAAQYSPALPKLAAKRRLRDACTRRRTLCLTYDDGPGDALTPAVLDLLARHRAVASFFVLGRAAAARPAAMQRILAGGHEVGCHTDRHLHAWKSAPWSVWRDIRDGFASLDPWLPAQPLFRPPHGKLLLSSWWQVSRLGARIAWWTHDSGDTYRSLPSIDALVDRVARDAGGVVLLHDCDRPDPARAEFVLAATERLLQVARRDGLRVARLGDLLRRASPAGGDC